MSVGLVLPPYCIRCRTRMLPGSTIMVAEQLEDNPYNLRHWQAIHLDCLTENDEIFVPEPWEMEGL